MDPESATLLEESHIQSGIIDAEQQGPQLQLYPCNYEASQELKRLYLADSKTVHADIARKVWVLHLFIAVSAVDGIFRTVTTEGDGNANRHESAGMDQRPSSPGHPTTNWVNLAWLRSTTPRPGMTRR